MAIAPDRTRQGDSVPGTRAKKNADRNASNDDKPTANAHQLATDDAPGAVEEMQMASRGCFTRLAM